MTKQEQATLDELRMTEADLAARQAKVSQLLNGEATLPDQLKASIALVDEKKRPRSKPIKGICVNCGRHWSRHFTRDVDSKLAYCHAGAGSQLFSLEHTEAKTGTYTPGLLAPEQVARLRDLIDTKQSRLAELDAINDLQARVLAEVDAATAELDAYLRELQRI